MGGTCRCHVAPRTVVRLLLGSNARVTDLGTAVSAKLNSNESGQSFGARAKLKFAPGVLMTRSTGPIVLSGTFLPHRSMPTWIDDNSASKSSASARDHGAGGNGTRVRGANARGIKRLPP